MMLYIRSGDTPPSILEPRKPYAAGTKEMYDGAKEKGGVGKGPISLLINRKEIIRRFLCFGF